ncbi:MAG TPA: PQQ-binding-like beta-propeller repeat protein [Gemmataceae bacterium]|nr:PQQ-binding-like beta-propeller repeat protein [Gemmataceae bacterium]
MHRFVLICALVVGCGQPRAAIQEPPTQPQSRVEAPRPPAVADQPPLAPVDTSADLGTRKTGCDWPSFLGPFGTGVSPEKGIIHPWPGAGLRIVWHQKVGIGYGMPTISRGRLFQFDRYGNQARLTCMKNETGEFLWKFEYPTDYADFYSYNNGPRCSPIVDGDRVYIHGVEGMLHCVHTLDGKLLWKVDTQAEFGFVQNFFGVASNPVVEGNLLIVQVGGSPKGPETSPTLELKGNGSGIVAFDKLTGRVVYRATDELASYATPVLATIEKRRWCFVFARGGLIGMDPATGKVDFHYPWRARILESVNASLPVVVGDHVFISETYGPGSSLLKVKPGGYEVLWTDADKGRQKSMQCHWSTPIYHEGYLYGSSGRHDNNAELRCVELETGKVMWSRPGLTRTSLLMVDCYFICLAEEGHLLLLKVNPHRYEEISCCEVRAAPRKPGFEGELLVEYPCWAAPILSHGLLYVRGKDRLVCLELIPEKH